MEWPFSASVVMTAPYRTVVHCVYVAVCSTGILAESDILYERRL